MRHSVYLSALRHAFRHGNWITLGAAALNRVSPTRLSRQADQARVWAEGVAQDYAPYAASLDNELWAEAEEFGAALEAKAASLLSHAQTKFGGGGAFRYLYFLTRRTKPLVAVETGVAAGWSSAAILAAMEKNGAGRLYSSDFPYFVQNAPIDEIGILVPPHLRSRWKLFVGGDRENIPLIMSEIERIDLFHYDSDKTEPGRIYALSALKSKFTPKATIIFDDIQDDLHFKRLSQGVKSALVFSEGRKYLGQIKASEVPDLSK